MDRLRLYSVSRWSAVAFYLLSMAFQAVAFHAATASDEIRTLHQSAIIVVVFGLVATIVMMLNKPSSGGMSN